MMIKRHGILVVAIALVLLWIGTAGCSKEEPPKKTSIEKLDSKNPEEQKEGLEEINTRYGGSQPEEQKEGPDETERKSGVGQ
jgi:hypothetical protein